jgi:hypothetical protein
MALAFLGTDTAANAPFADSRLTHIATVRLRAEVTGMYVTSAGDFFLDVQHTELKILDGWSKAAINHHLTEFFFGNAAYGAISSFQQT